MKREQSSEGAKLRLFCVRSNKTNKRVWTQKDEEVSDGYFESKQEAKLQRDYWNSQGKETFRVSRGPDHMGPHGNKTLPKYRRQPK